MEKLGILANVCLYRILGILFLVVGALYILSPRTMKKIDEVGKKLLWQDDWSITHRIGFGIFFLIVGLLLCYTGFVLLKR
ncbi:hypothetical protein L6386_06510 [bacterium]|nr:hypothetical protein [bacterium]MBU4311026.1 hypothetical protein [bacterium]MCG2676584.1 hypothetical protein [bacterium]MCG2678182.1 hypothetical protein [bacterium]